jgi:hypothetical protein
MSKLTFLAFTLSAITALGCSSEVPLAPAPDAPGATRQIVQIPHVDRAELDHMEQLAAMPDGGLAVIGQGLKMVEVPDGSVNALAAAIAQAGPNGMVLLKSGTHTETATVKIQFAVHVIGEEGAELVTSAGGLSNIEPFPVVPALHITAGRVSVQNVAMRPASGDGNTAILVEGASHTTLFRNRMTGYQFGVLVASGDHSRIWANSIVTTSAWQTGAVANAFGITLVNGAHASVMDNDVSNSLFGIWPCGAQGELAFNSAHGNFVGIILCRVPEALIELPGGTSTGAEFSSKDWVAVHNTTTGNFTTGFLVIDGASNNVIANNASSGNGAYDVELTGDSHRFGFLTPGSFENTFIAGAFSNIEVKNCGFNNTIIGGALVDNTLEPCD